MCGLLLICDREETYSVSACPMCYMDLPSGILHVVHDADDLEFVFRVSPVPSCHKFVLPKAQAVRGYYVHLLFAETRQGHLLNLTCPEHDKVDATRSRIAVDVVDELLRPPSCPLVFP